MFVRSNEDSSLGWRSLEQAALRAFMEIGGADSQGVIATLKRAVRYATVDHEANRVVIGTRAFAFGLLAAGRFDAPSAQYGNTATWLANFVGERFPGLDTILSAMPTGMDAVLDAASRNYVVEASSSLSNVGVRARTIASDTVDRPDADLRHFVAALLVTVRGSQEFLEAVGWSTSTGEITAPRRTLYDRIAHYSEPGENLEAWREILQASNEHETFEPSLEPGHPKPGHSTIPVDRSPTEVSGFAPDSPTAFAINDSLDLRADVTAFARLICLQDVDPRLSIGLFGGWGSGKSTFMHRLEATVEDLTRNAQIKPAEHSEGPVGPSFIRNAVQIRFNAWHFADANL